MKLLNLLITIIISFQFIYYPITYAQVDVGHGENVYSMDDILLKVKQLLRLKKYEGYSFLNKNKQKISLDNLMKLKEEYFFIVSSKDNLAIQVKPLPINQDSKEIKVALQVFDSTFKNSFSTNIISLDIRKNQDAISQINSINKQISLIEREIDTKLGKNSRRSKISGVNNSFLKSVALFCFAIGILNSILYFLALHFVDTKTIHAVGGATWYRGTRGAKIISIVLFSVALIAYLSYSLSTTEIIESKSKGKIREFKDIPKLSINESINKDDIERLRIQKVTKDNGALIDVNVGNSSISLSSDLTESDGELFTNIAETTLSYTSRPIKLAVSISCAASTDFISPNAEPYGSIQYSRDGKATKKEIEKDAIIELPLNHRGSLIFDIFEDDIIFNDEIGFCTIDPSNMQNILRGKNSAKCSISADDGEVCSVTVTKI